jgi:hypothetical protein
MEWKLTDRRLEGYSEPVFASGAFFLAPQVSYPAANFARCDWCILHSGEKGVFVQVAEWDGDGTLQIPCEQEIVDQQMAAVKLWADAELRRLQSQPGIF